MAKMLRYKGKLYKEVESRKVLVDSSRPRLRRRSFVDDIWSETIDPKNVNALYREVKQDVKRACQNAKNNNAFIDELEENLSRIKHSRNGMTMAVATPSKNFQNTAGWEGDESLELGLIINHNKWNGAVGVPHCFYIDFKTNAEGEIVKIAFDEESLDLVAFLESSSL